MTGAFFLPDGDRFVPTEHTVGPWDARAQHAGPPAALLGRALEACEPREEMRIVRVTFEILRPVPLEPLHVAAALTRPGRRVEFLEASMRTAAGGAEVMRAAAWRIRAADVGVSWIDERIEPPPGPATAEPLPSGAGWGYMDAMEWRLVRGGMTERGPASAWMRMRHPLVADEDPSPLVRVLIAADSGNGISSVLDLDRYLFINTDLSVHLHRMPVGEWVNLDAATTVERDGIGTTRTTLWDEKGRIGLAAQSLLIAPREG